MAAGDRRGGVRGGGGWAAATVRPAEGEAARERRRPAGVGPPVGGGEKKPAARWQRAWLGLAAVEGGGGGAGGGAGAWGGGGWRGSDGKSLLRCVFPLAYAGNRLPGGGGSPAREPPHPSFGSRGLEPCAERSNRHGILHSWDPGCGVGGASRRRRWARLGSAGGWENGDSGRDHGDRRCSSVQELATSTPVVHSCSRGGLPVCHWHVGPSAVVGPTCQSSNTEWKSREPLLLPRRRSWLSDCLFV